MKITLVLAFSALLILAFSGPAESANTEKEGQESNRLAIKEHRSKRDSVIDTILAILKLLKKALDSAINQLEGFIKELKDPLKNIVQTLMDDIKKLIASIDAAIKALGSP